MEAVDELEAERNQQGDEQHEIGQEARDPGPGRVDVGIDAVGDEQQGCGNDAEINNACQRMKAFIEIRSLFEGRLNRAG